MDQLTDLTIFAASGVPGTSPSARLAVPLGILVFYGSIYLLLRANLGTRRAYLVLGTSFFGFMFIMSLFWTFGAPGTPQAAGPTYLPTQPSDAYQPTWTPFAGDSLVAEREDYAFVQDFPDGFSELPEAFASSASAGVDTIKSFFSESGNAPNGFDEDWEVADTLYAEAPNGFPVIAATFEEPAPEEGEEPPEEPAEPVTLFAFFDEGAPLHPGRVFIAIALAGFLLHIVLLNADERREQRDLEEVAEQEEDKVPAGA